MLDRCAPRYSCGTLFPMWSNAKIPPNDIGVEHTVKFYSTRNDGCTSTVEYNMKVLRCPDNTLIYKYIALEGYNATCTSAFCGMN